MEASKKNVPLTERTIPGITWKQVAALIVTVALVVWGYFNILQQAKDSTKAARDVYEQDVINGGILKEMQVERKEAERINNIRLTNIELDQREAKIRLTSIETQLNKNGNK